MGGIGVEFEPFFPWLIMGSLAILAAVVIALALFVRSPGVFWRAVFVVVIFLALLNPTLMREQRDYLPDVVGLVVDQSTSQQIGNRSEVTNTAKDQLLAVLGKTKNLEIRSTVVEDISGDKGTQMFASLERIFSDISPDRVAGSFFITDGQVHDVPKRSNRIEYAGPLHVLLTGSPNEEDRRMIIEKSPSYAIVGDTIQLLIRVEDTSSHGTSVPVTLSADGELLSTTEVEVGKTAEIEIMLDREGIIAFEVEVEPGASELTLDNNRITALINGVRERLRVMLVSGEPGTGLRTMRNLLKADPAVDLIHFTVLRPPSKQDLTPVSELSLIPFPSGELFAANLKKFDLVIFDRYHRRGILPTAYLNNLVDYVLTGGAVLDIAGPSFSSSLSLAMSPLSAILPARPTGQVLEEPYQPILSDVGRRHPVTAVLYRDSGIEETAHKPNWGRWFRLMEATVVRGDTLMMSPDENPLLVVDRIGEGRVAQILSDQSWLWARGFEGGGPQQLLLRRLVHWLMKQPDLEEEALSATVKDGQLSIIRRSLLPVTGLATVQGPRGSVDEMELVDSGDGRATTNISVKSSGLYRIKHGELSAIAAVGGLNSLEGSDVRTTDKALMPVVLSSSGSLTWFVEEGIPEVRRIARSAPKTGLGWLGLVSNESYKVTGQVRTPLAPEIILLVLLLCSVFMAWRAEGR